MYLYIHIIIYLCQHHPVIHYIYRSMSFCCLLYISGPVAHLLIYILFDHLLYIFISPTDCILFAHIYTVLNSPSLFSLLILYSSSYTTCYANLCLISTMYIFHLFSSCQLLLCYILLYHTSSSCLLSHTCTPVNIYVLLLLSF